MARRKVRDEDEARALLEGFATSDMDMVAWARARGIDGRSLNAWKLNLAKRGPTADAPVRVVELVPRTAPTHTAAITLRCGRFTVDVPADVDDDHLARVLAVVAAC